MGVGMVPNPLILDVMTAVVDAQVKDVVAMIATLVMILVMIL